MGIFSNVPHASEIAKINEDRKYQAFLEDIATQLKKTGRASKATAASNVEEDKELQSLAARFFEDESVQAELKQKGYQCHHFNGCDLLIEPSQKKSEQLFAYRLFYTEETSMGVFESKMKYIIARSSTEAKDVVGSGHDVDAWDEGGIKLTPGTILD